MTEKNVLDFHVFERKKYNLLKEVLDTTQQMGASIDRSDEYSVAMLLDMRQETVDKLLELRFHMSERLEEMPFREAQYIKKMLNGITKTSTDPKEMAFITQIHQNKDLLKEAMSLGERVNLRMSGGKSPSKIKGK